MKNLDYLHRLPEEDEPGEENVDGDDGGSGLPPKTPPPIPPLSEGRWVK